FRRVLFRSLPYTSAIVRQCSSKEVRFIVVRATVRAACFDLRDRQMKTYQYKPDAQASAFHRHAENACTRLRVGLVLPVQPVGSLLPIALLANYFLSSLTSRS